MSITETEFRDRLVRIAREWIGTPFHYNACVKGAGTDCARLLVGVMREAGCLPEEPIEVFAPDWHCHAAEDKYLLRALRRGTQMAEAVAYASLDVKPGCLMLLKVPGGRVSMHGAIVTRWPLVCHAVHPAVEEINAARHPMWMHKEITVLDPWLKMQERLA